jgi:heat shock protein HslJ
MAVVAAAGVAVAFTVSGCGSSGSPGSSEPDKPVDFTGTTWQLLEIESMAQPNEEPSLKIADPSRYTVTFGDDGQAGFRVDCNRGNSTWKVEAAGPDSGSMSFGPIALTKMMCPQPSDDGKVAPALGRVRSYLVKDGKLHLSLEADSGIMHFQPSPGN